MTTENGIPKTATARNYIDRLRRRYEFLVEKEHTVGPTKTEEVRNLMRAEIAALEWAFPVLEAEADRIMRLQRKIKQSRTKVPEEVE